MQKIINDADVLEKINYEKRKRIQAYNTLNHFLSAYSYFDFFSLDAFQIAKHSRFWAQNYNQEVVEKEFLLLPFTEEYTILGSMLREEKITKANVKSLISITPIKEKGIIPSYLDNILFSLKMYFSEKRIRFNKKIHFSEEVDLIFETAAENALTRFKTPVITPEILLITLLEEKEFFKSFVSKRIDWLLLRYSLIKRIHYQEVNVRRQVMKNQRCFAYLLKTRISEQFFNRLIARDLLLQGVQQFRNALILKILKYDFAKCAEQEIVRSNRIISTRKYSS